VRDRKYRRKYLLDRFLIAARKATADERLEPFERYRRAFRKVLAKRQPFEVRSYLTHEGFDFDSRLLDVVVRGTIYLDGLWLSERYFADAAEIVRGDLRIQAPDDHGNRDMCDRIRRTGGVALHVRWFDAPGSAAGLNVSADYYRQAVALMDLQAKQPHYFLFSDYPDEARALIGLPEGRLTVVSHNGGDDNAYADLWLMTQCQHFITANSSFSWWGAWLAPHHGKIVMAPDLARRFSDVPDSRELIPADWVRV
jgi:hypothetical protein